MHAAATLIGVPDQARRRKIFLRDEWWRKDHGPLMGFLRESTEAVPVALMPGRGGYRLIDPARGIDRKVDAAVAAGLKDEAWVFYEPLPERLLTFFDLLRAAFFGRRREIVTLLSLTAATGLLALLTPLITGHVADIVIPRANRVELMHMVVALGVSAIAAALLELSRGLMLLRLKSATSISLQAAMWDRLLAMPASFFRRFSSGDLTARSMGIDHLQQLLTSDVATALFSMLSATFSLAILFYYDFTLALVAGSSAIALVLTMVATGFSQLAHLRSMRSLSGRLNSLVYTLITAMPKLRAAGGERLAFERWAEQFSEVRHHANGVRRISNIQSVTASAIGSCSVIAIFAIAGFSSGRDIGAGDFLAFNAAFAQFQAAALACVSVLPTLLSFAPVYERLQPLLKSPPESHAGQEDPGRLRGSITLCNVSFAYPGRPAVLDQVSIQANPGEFIALVGPSGSGKSTCLRLMLGFEEQASGTVLIDNKNTRSLNMDLARRQFGVVLQNGSPLAGDIFRTITGSLPLTLEDAWRAARFVAIEDEIRSMPMSMFTVVNARGVSFSGGQRQRLFLARAIASGPRILLLDEATSALDNKTQEVVSRNLASLGITRVVVAHRLSTIRHADRIYVLDRGRIVEEGRFEDLIKKGGLFSRMAARQLL